jgi:DNA-binding CsgD family transcriptional regulator
LTDFTSPLPFDVHSAGKSPNASDEKLLQLSHSFSAREFEIIKLIKEGFESEQIAEKLFLSKHIVNTHRKNILDKTGKSHISDLIFFPEDQGLL